MSDAMKMKRGTIASILMFATVLMLMQIAGGCKSREKILTIGINKFPSNQTKMFDGFKEGMTELGYIEGKNIKYVIYPGSNGSNDQIVNAEIKRLLSQDIDLILTVYNETAMIAKKTVDGTNTPVIAIACNRPIEIGLVKSLLHPGGNVTGIQLADTLSKGFEWLTEITPHAKKIYLPYNFDNMASTLQLAEVKKTATKMGIELVLQKVNSVKEAVAAIEGLPKDIDAIYWFPSIAIGPNSRELSSAAIKRGLPMGSGIILDEAVLMTFTIDPFEMGKQAAHLAHQIHQGVKPGDLPMETSEVYLTINLKTADKIGLKIPDNILARANKIIR
jgi:putative tryptophan/tyrosine transport system substrate-binding protein